MTEMWQLEKRKPYYLIQTDDRAIATKLKRRDKYELVAEGIGCNFWIFSIKYSRPDIARKTLRGIVKYKPKFDSEREIYSCPTHIIKTKKKTS